MDKVIKEAIEKTIKTLGSEKGFFIISNGGWEKYFETELAFCLYDTLRNDGYNVSMQDNRVDIKIRYPNNNNNKIDIIEIGHYTLNQTKIEDQNKFKVYTDIEKRKFTSYNTIYHIMLDQLSKKTQL